MAQRRENGGPLIDIINRLPEGGGRGAIIDVSKSGVSPTFRMDVGARVSSTTLGVEGLPQNVTINGTTVSPTAYFVGSDAGATTWTCRATGTDLTLTTGSTNPTLGAATPLLDGTTAVTHGASDDYYEATDSSFGNIGTNDIVIEALCRVDSATDNKYFSYKLNSNVGFTLAWFTDGFNFYLRDDDTTLRAIAGASTLEIGQWNLIHVFVDRDENNSTTGASFYYNGVAAGTADLSGGSGDADNSGLFGLTGTSGAGLRFPGKFAHYALWQSSGWFAGGATNTSDWGSFARERMARLAGIYPQVARGTAVPTEISRGSAAHLDRYVSSARSLFYVGPSWPRVCERKDTSGTSKYGYLAEQERENLCLQSEDFSTTWSKLDAGDTITTNDTAPPVTDPVSNNADALTADATDGDHGYSQAITLTAARHVFSVWIKPGNKTWAYLSNDTVANATAYFNLSSTGSLGTVGAGCTAYIEAWENSWYRCAISFTGTAAAHTLKIQTADGDGDKTVTGDGSTKNMYTWGAQCCLNAHGYPTSYIPTTTAAVTRNRDVLTFSSTSNFNEGVGTIEAHHMTENYDMVDTGSGSRLVEVSDSTTVDYHVVDLVAAADKARTFVQTGSVNQGTISGTSDLFDGDEHDVRQIYGADDIRLFVDGTEEGTAVTSATMPTGLTDIDIGSSDFSAGAGSTSKIITKVRLWPNKTKS